jgi:glycosyltransferase involved in cell wall biosynthesis
MKIALLHLYLATASGDPRMVLSIAQELKRQGHQVVLYCAEFDPKQLPNLTQGLEIRVVPPQAPLSSVLGSSGFFGKIRDRMRQRKLHTDAASRIERELDPDFDFVYCENDYSYKAGAMYKKRNSQAKIVWVMNNPQFYHSHKKNPLVNFASWVTAWQEGRIAKQFVDGIDWAIVYDVENKRMAEALGFTVKLIGNPLDYHYFYHPVKMIEKDMPVQLFAVGALSPQRRFEDVVSATAILRQQGYNVRALIICKDYYADRAYRQSFEAFIAASGAADVIDARFAGVDEATMMESIHASHVSVVPQSAKVWIATACEAMAAGMPLVISRATSMVDVLVDGEEALFFTPRKPEEIAARIKELVDNPVRYASIATAGQNYVKNNLSFEQFVKESMRTPGGERN